MTIIYKKMIDEILEVCTHLEMQLVEYENEMEKYLYTKTGRIISIFRFRHIDYINDYCNQIVKLIDYLKSVINAYHKMADLNISSIYIYWQHRNLITSIKTQLYSLKSYKEYKKKHAPLGISYINDYNDLVNNIRMLLNNNNKNTYKSQHRSKSSSNATPNEVLIALKIIGITKIDSSINSKTIQTYYRKAAKANHPDRGGSLEKMQQINQAYDTLKKYYTN